MYYTEWLARCSPPRGGLHRGGATHPRESPWVGPPRVGRRVFTPIDRVGCCPRQHPWVEPWVLPRATPIVCTMGSVRLSPSWNIRAMTDTAVYHFYRLVIIPDGWVLSRGWFTRSLLPLGQTWLEKINFYVTNNKAKCENFSSINTTARIPLSMSLV